MISNVAPFASRAFADPQLKLYQLYLTPANSSLAHRLYVERSSSNPFIQATIAFQLHRAAEAELAKASSSHTISEAEIMREAGDAFQALATLLGQDEWFFGEQGPSLFDASVFAYTHLVLSDHMQWRENKLMEMLRGSDALVQHRERILEMYY